MPYDYESIEAYDDESWRPLLESDDEGWEREVGEAVGPRYRRNTPIARPLGRKPVTGVKGAQIRTPTGTAQVNFGQPVAAKESVEKIATDVARISATLATLEKRLETNTATLDRKVNTLETRLRASAEQGQTGLLLPLLFSTPPKIKELEVTGANNTKTTLNISDTKYQPGNNSLLPLILMMSGGLGGAQGGSGDNSTMLLAVLALSGGLNPKS